MGEKKYRLVTRSDFDGLVCAVLFKELGMIQDIKFVHPKDMQDGTILISESDITTNLPYVKGVHLAFDHHASELTRLGKNPENYISVADSPSTSRVVFNHFGGSDRFPNVSLEMMDAVDKSDSAQFTREDILNPQGLGPAQLHHGCAHRSGTFPGFSDFQLSAHVGTHRLLPGSRD